MALQNDVLVAECYNVDMRIAIVGYGIEGKSNYRYCRNKYPDAEIVIFDESESLNNAPDGVQTILGKGAFQKVAGFDLIMRSPSIPPRAIAQQDNHWSNTREFMRRCPAPVIGVTGSKGKGTTCSFIAEILKAHFADQPDRHVYLVGNIGVPALDVLDDVTEDDVVVYEMSSFQLWDCTKSPAIAVITMIEPDHLNVHKDFQEYVNAKLNIIYYQHDGNTAVYNQEEASPELAELINHIIATTQADDMPYPYRVGAHFDDDNLMMGDEVVCPIKDIKLPGRHNLLNACAAMAATWEITGHDKEAIAKGLAAFEGLPHRLKFVRDVNGTRFYDDSIATTPGSAIAAVKAFDQPKVLILGGSDKGADYHELGRVIGHGNVRVVLAIGANRSKIAEQIMDETEVSVVQSSATSMQDIVQTVYDLSNPGDVVILSPAAASFDMFKSYQDRGDQFIAAVNGL